MSKKILYLDIETTDLPEKGFHWKTHYNKYPRIVQISWDYQNIMQDYIVKPKDANSKKPYGIPAGSTAIHGITTERAMAEGKCIDDCLDRLLFVAEKADVICCHNIYFDVSIIKANVLRTYPKNIEMFNKALHKDKRLDTMFKTIKFVNAKHKDGRGGKWPTLQELHFKLFKEGFDAHNSKNDVIALKRCVEKLIELKVIVL